MCGVIAAIGPDAESYVDTGLEMLKHRGIRTGVMFDRDWGIGHVRLPIVGIGEEYDQPAMTDDWAVAFVGELLNFKDYMPGSECDFDLVLKTVEHWGFEGFRRYDGFWAVVAVNREDGSLHCLVDYLSQKPLYARDDVYARAVASEPDAVVMLGPVEYDPIYLSAVVKWGYCPETWRTPYRGIRRMLPGEYLVMSPHKTTFRCTLDELGPPIGSTPAELKIAIEEAVKRRVQSSDVPVACLVSGGLDSTIVYTLAGRYGDIHPYHVENGEWDLCSRVAPDATRVDYSEVQISTALEWMQEPLDLGSLIPQANLSAAIHGVNGERVCLTGDGADEMFGGYGRSQRYDSQASDIWHELVGWHLPRLDRIMMRNQIEVRSPFLSRQVVEIAMGLPRSMRTNKQILRDLFVSDIPLDSVVSEKRPLRTKSVESNRELHSKNLVNMFMEMNQCRRLVRR